MNPFVWSSNCTMALLPATRVTTAAHHRLALSAKSVKFHSTSTRSPGSTTVGSCTYNLRRFGIVSNFHKFNRSKRFVRSKMFVGFVGFKKLETVGDCWRLLGLVRWTLLQPRAKRRSIRTEQHKLCRKVAKLCTTVHVRPKCYYKKHNVTCQSNSCKLRPTPANSGQLMALP